MPLQFFSPSDVLGINLAMVDFVVSGAAALPDDLRERLRTALVTGALGDKVVDMAELLYANRDAIDGHEAGLVMMAQLFAFGSANSWSSFNAEGRCDKIVLAARRDLGEAGEFPGRQEDPEPLARMRLPEPAQAEAAPPAPEAS